MRLKIICLFVLFITFAVTSGDDAEEKKIVCYFGSWSIYRPGKGKFDILSDVDSSLCTHLIYAFVGLSYDLSLHSLDPWADLPNNGGLNGFGKINSFRSENLKTLISIGGWNEGSRKYSQMAASETARKAFAEEAVKFCLEHGFDGLDLDWEYPGQRGGDPDMDKDNYVLLLRELREWFDKHDLILSATVAATEKSARKSYDVKAMGEAVDFVNVMAYDMHGSWDKKAGLNAPLFPKDWEKGDDRQLNVEASVKFWLSEGLPPQKLILGVPLYGRTFGLDSAEHYSIGSAASGEPWLGPYTRESGFVGYNEICEAQLNEKDWTLKFDKEQRCPYAFKGNRWVGYDNQQSVLEKAELVSSLNLGGAMVWSVETDDFRGVCGSKYPLLKTLNQVLRGDPDKPTTTTQRTTSTSDTPTTAKTTTTTITTSTEPSGRCDLSCKQPGFLRDGDDCAKFYRCVADPSGFRRFEFTCQTGTVFDLDNSVCNWPDNVDCSTCA